MNLREGVIRDIERDPQTYQAVPVDAAATALGNGVDLCMLDVGNFHAACDQAIRPFAQTITDAERDFRAALIKEEWQETHDAMMAGDLTEIADGLADMIYVICGTAHFYGIPLGRVWAEVQHSNMLKVNQETGKVSKYPSGKVVKPEGWQPPDIATVLQEHRHEWNLRNDPA